MLVVKRLICATLMSSLIANTGRMTLDLQATLLLMDLTAPKKLLLKLKLMIVDSCKENKKKKLAKMAKMVRLKEVKSNSLRMIKTDKFRVVSRLKGARLVEMVRVKVDKDNNRTFRVKEVKEETHHYLAPMVKTVKG